MIRLKRVYDPPAQDDGERWLAERLWPRGIRREDARLYGWLKELSPSPALRRWYGHNQRRWREFQERYRAELRDPDKQPALAELAEKARHGTITLVYAARDTERNSAVVLKRILDTRSRT